DGGHRRHAPDTRLALNCGRARAHDEPTGRSNGRDKEGSRVGRSGCRLDAGGDNAPSRKRNGGEAVGGVGMSGQSVRGCGR
ncbi:hypothetical protein B0H10DRAFT_1987606, partial [Mycena sp. CBHHK59/15]